MSLILTNGTSNLYSPGFPDGDVTGNFVLPTLPAGSTTVTLDYFINGTAISTPEPPSMIVDAFLLLPVVGAASLMHLKRRTV